jgi:hypothetical protein
MEKDYNDLIEKCFASDVTRRKYKNSGPSSNYKQIVVRAYSDPIFGVVPAFTFNGEWEDRIENEYSGNRLREYTLSFNTKIGRFSWVLAGGLTYDDPSKGRNQRSPDRRLTLACTVNVNSELEIQGNYVYYNDDKRKGYSCVTYTPEAIKGLELCQEFTTRPGVRDRSFSAKYDHRFFAIKVEENMTNTYEDKEAKTRDSHDNEQRVTFSTGISAKGLCRHKNNGINILRD